MKLLLDTGVILRFIVDIKLLNVNMVKLILDNIDELYISMETLFEFKGIVGEYRNKDISKLSDENILKDIGMYLLIMDGKSDFTEFLSILSNLGIKIVYLDEKLLNAYTELKVPGYDIKVANKNNQHKDPSDLKIISSAKVISASIVTTDTKMNFHKNHYKSEGIDIRYFDFKVPKFKDYIEVVNSLRLIW